MGISVVGYGAEGGGLVGHTGEHGELLGYLDTRNIRLDRPEFASRFAAGLGLEVPRVLLWRSAGHEEEDASFGRTKFSWSRCRLSTQEVRQKQPGCAQAAYLEQLAP